MMVTIARDLPPYQQLYEVGKGAQRRNSQSHDERASTVMSYVYADMVQFCLDLCRLFSRGPPLGTLLFYVRNLSHQPGLATPAQKSRRARGRDPMQRAFKAQPNDLAHVNACGAQRSCTAYCEVLLNPDMRSIV